MIVSRGSVHRTHAHNTRLYNSHEIFLRFVRHKAYLMHQQQQNTKWYDIKNIYTKKKINFISKTHWEKTNRQILIATHRAAWSSDKPLDKIWTWWQFYQICNWDQLIQSGTVLFYFSTAYLTIFNPVHFQWSEFI